MPLYYLLRLVCSAREGITGKPSISVNISGLPPNRTSSSRSSFISCFNWLDLLSQFVLLISIFASCLTLLKFISFAHNLNERVSFFFSLSRCDVLVCALISLENYVQCLLDWYKLICTFQWWVIKSEFTCCIFKVRITVIIITTTRNIVSCSWLSVLLKIRKLVFDLIEANIRILLRVFLKRLIVIVFVIRVFKSIGDVLFIILKVLDSLFMHLMCQATHLFRNLGQILLHHWWDCFTWCFQDGEETPDNTTNLKLELEVAHVLQPVWEHC